MKKKKQKLSDWVYISGKISDKSEAKVRKNIEIFNAKEEELKDIWVNRFNPAKLEIEGATWEYYLARDLTWIAQHSPDLYMMKGWINSKGARLEREFAKQLGLNIFYEEPFDGLEK